MRILIILKYIPSQVSDRKADAITAFIHAHEKAGFNVVLLTTGREEKHEWDSIDVKPNIFQKILLSIINIFSKQRSKQYRESIITNAVAAYHKKNKIDVVFAYCTADHPAIHALAIKDKLGIPFVVREHKIYERKINTINDLSSRYLSALKKANKVIAVSPQLADIMMRLGIRDDIDHVPNTISDTFFDEPEDLGVFRNWAADAFLFAGWTRWREFKRPELLVKAFAQMQSVMPNARLVIAGVIESDNQKSMIESTIKEYGIDEKVWLHGVATRKEIHELAHSCDCCVISSDYETFGLPALEALAAGRPVIATRCNGPESIITSEKLGRIVERSNVQELADAMLEVYNSQESFDTEYIKSYALKNYSESALSEKLKQIYNKICHEAT